MAGFMTFSMANYASVGADTAATTKRTKCDGNSFLHVQNTEEIDHNGSDADSCAVKDPAVTVWKRRHRIIYLLGTAHISQASAELAGRLIRQVQPHAILVELDQARLQKHLDRQKQNNNNSQVQEELLSPIFKDIRVDPQRPDQTGDDGAFMGTEMNEGDYFSFNDTDSAVASKRNKDNNNKSRIIVPRFSHELDLAPLPELGFWTKLFVSNATLAVNLMLQLFYRGLGQTGFEPGGEFLEAIRVAQSIQADIVMGDRPVSVTLNRFLRALAKSYRSIEWDQVFKALEEFEEEEEEEGQSPQQGEAEGDANKSGADDDNDESTDSILFGTNNEELPNNENATVFSPSPKKSSRTQRDELAQQVERLKSRERIHALLETLKRHAPLLFQVFLEERDHHMACILDAYDDDDIRNEDDFGVDNNDNMENRSSTKESHHQRQHRSHVMVAVMGMAHQEGIEHYLMQQGWEQLRVTNHVNGVKCE